MKKDANVKKNNNHHPKKNKKTTTEANVTVPKEERKQSMPFPSTDLQNGRFFVTRKERLATLLKNTMWELDLQWDSVPYKYSTVSPNQTIIYKWKRTKWRSVCAWLVDVCHAHPVPYNCRWGKPELNVRLKWSPRAVAVWQSTHARQ